MLVQPRTRLFIATSVAALMAIASVSLAWTGVTIDTTIDEPPVHLGFVPISLGSWTGSKVTLSTQEYEAIGAVEVASLSLENQEGIRGFAHLAVWTNPEIVGMMCPHHPQTCYSGAGWDVVQSEIRELQIGELDSIPIAISVVQRGGARAIIAYSYAMGSNHFTDSASVRATRLKFLGVRNWPPTYKFLVQINVEDISTGKEAAADLMRQLIDWYHATRSANLHSSPLVAVVS